MKFSLWLFKNWYEQNKIGLSSFISDTDRKIEQILYRDTLPNETADNTAFILPGNALEDCSGFRSALCFGRDRLLFPVTAPETIYNLGNEMIEQFTAWEHTLRQQILGGTAIPELLDTIETRFPFPLAICRKSGRILYHSESWHLNLPSDIAGQLTEQFQKGGRPGQTFFFTSRMMPSCTFLGVIPESSGQKKWSLLTYDENNWLQPGDTHIFLTALELIQDALSYESEQTASLHPLSKWFTDTLTAETSAGTDSLPAGSVDWEFDDYYLIACIQADDIQPSCYPELITSITNPDYCCTLSADSISVLIHLGKEWPNDIGKIKERIETRCNNYHVKIGYSLRFQGLSQIPLYHKQSLWAVSEAIEKKIHSCSLEDALPDYLLKSCRSVPEIQAYIHPEIRTLAEADTGSGDELLRTLYTYLILGRSAARTAEALFIHRNTLRNRLNKIREIISPDFEDESLRDHILLSLIIHPQTETE